MPRDSGRLPGRGKLACPRGELHCATAPSCERLYSPAGFSRLPALESAFRSDPRLERLGLDFLVSFLERARLRQPRNAEVLAELGSTYTKLGRFREGLAVDRELVRIAPSNATAHYNLACSLALCDELQAALDSLEAAVEHGYDDAHHLAHDEDLRALRSEPRFDALVKRLTDAKA